MVKTTSTSLMMGRKKPYGFSKRLSYSARYLLQVNNLTNTQTIQSMICDYNLDGIYATDEEIMNGTPAQNYQAMVVEAGDTNTAYSKWETKFAPWSARLGFKFSF
jgi:hypothetical protein